MSKYTEFIYRVLDEKNINDPEFAEWCVVNFDYLKKDCSYSVSKFSENVETYLLNFLNKDILRAEDLVKTNINMNYQENYTLIVSSVSDYLPAIKDVLWNLKNKPSTGKFIMDHIYKEIDGELIKYYDTVTDGYSFINNVFKYAVHRRELILQKIKGKNGKEVWLYSNPTDKRYGYYYKGKLYSLKELSAMSGVGITTIQKRLAKNKNVENAIRPV